MRLVHAALTCGFCGEETNATIPLSALNHLIFCASCDRQAVTADHGLTAVPIPETSEIALHWHLGVVAEPFLARNGGRWARC